MFLNRTAGSVQAAEQRRCLLAWRREAADAPAHLRDGMGDAGRPRSVPVALEEAKKRDHRKLGRELDLFTSTRSPAAPFWHRAAWRSSTRSRSGRSSVRGGGFDEIRTPSSCAASSGSNRATGTSTRTTCSCWTRDEQVASFKPMNCPGGDPGLQDPVPQLPRPADAFSDYSTLFRKERTGALAGLFRVRQLTQDDSHVFCREDQVADELRLALNFVQRQYAPFGFTRPSSSPRGRRRSSG